MHISKILITGAAGFIGAAVFQSLIQKGIKCVGIDNLNNYYSTNLKLTRLRDIGFNIQNEPTENEVFEKDLVATFIKLDIQNYNSLNKLFSKHHFDYVLHFAAQAGVRHSLDYPRAYTETNIHGFLNILECCRNNPIKHLLYASSSSVYGNSSQTPFTIESSTDKPLSLYAATKKANEVMAHSYSHLFRIPSTGLRFFTVYGPWGRPDMAPILFAQSIMNKTPILVHNYGEMYRDFTYINDIVESTIKLIPHPPEYISQAATHAPHRILNIGKGSPVRLLDFIYQLENSLGKKAILNLVEMPKSDVGMTWADTTELEKITKFKPKIPLSEGIEEFALWFKKNYKLL